MNLMTNIKGKMVGNGGEITGFDSQENSKTKIILIILGFKL